jgi:hypothetical protein
MLIVEIVSLWLMWMFEAPGWAYVLGLWLMLESHAAVMGNK